MEQKLFDTKERIDLALSALKTLITHPGWLLIEKILDSNIAFVKEQLEIGTGEEETKESIERLRDKLRVYKEVKDTPRNIITKLERGEEEEVITDPYEDVDQLRERKKELQNS